MGKFVIFLEVTTIFFLLLKLLDFPGLFSWLLVHGEVESLESTVRFLVGVRAEDVLIEDLFIRIAIGVSFSEVVSSVVAVFDLRFVIQVGSLTMFVFSILVFRDVFAMYLSNKHVHGFS